MTWYDRAGNVVGTIGAPGQYSHLALSPDGTQVVVDRVLNGNEDLWLYPTTQRGSTRLTSDDAADQCPVWSGDGRHVAFSSRRNGSFDLFQKRPEAAAEDEEMYHSPQIKNISDWSRDGKYLLYTNVDEKTHYDMWVLPVGGDHQPKVFLKTGVNEGEGQFSPDTKWIAYTSDESGQWEIYVRAFPDTGDKWRISTNGGSNAFWRRDGKEIYYVGPDSKMMAVRLDVKPGKGAASIDVAQPESLFQTPFPRLGVARRYDVTADGQRFLLITPLVRDQKSTVLARR